MYDGRSAEERLDRPEQRAEIEAEGSTALTRRRNPAQAVREHPAGPEDERLDEDVVRLMQVTLLKAEGWVVAEAASGDEALERCRHESFDVAVLDFMMPGMNGLQVARALRFEGIRLPTVLFTAYLVDELKRTCDDLGVVAVDKINWDELVLRCRELWERRVEARSCASIAVRRSRLLSPVGGGGASVRSSSLLPARAS